MGTESAARSRAGGQSVTSGDRTCGGGRGGRCLTCCCTSIAANISGWNDDRWHDLIVILDDATTEIYYAQLVEEESTRTVMAGLREVIEIQGLFPEECSRARVVALAHKKEMRRRLLKLCRAVGGHQPKVLTNQLLMLIEGTYSTAGLLGKRNAVNATAKAADALIDAAIA